MSAAEHQPAGALSSAQRALMARLRAGHAPAASTTRQPTAPPATSMEQQVMLAYQSAFPGTLLFNMPFAFRLDGALDRAALLSAVRRVVSRHEALRCRYTLEGVALADADEFKPDFVDLAALPPPHQAEVLAESARRLLRTPFDLTRELPLRLRLVALAEQCHVLFLCIHHIAFDGWSAELFSRELTLTYLAAVKGLPDPLPSLEHSYWEYADEQRQRHPTPSLQLRAAATRSSPAARTRRFIGRLPDVLTEVLRAYSRSQGVSLHALLLSAYGLLLAMQEGDATSVGLLSANRHDARFHEVIGPFYTSLSCELDPSAHPTLRAYLLATAEQLLDTADGCAVPSQSQPTQSYRHRFTFDRHPFRQLRLAGIALSLHEPVEAGAGASEFDTEAGTRLALFAREDSKTIHLALFDSCGEHATLDADDWFRRYADVLDLLVSEPQLPVVQAVAMFG